MSALPFVVGVTGHRDLRDADIPALTALIREQLRDWMRLCPHTDFYCMTSLAEGADQLCGRIALDLGMKLIVPLPMAKEAFEQDFSGAALAAFRALLQKADVVFVSPDTEQQGDASRDYAYRQAGIYVARHCHVLLALWDGVKMKNGTCGTAEAVDFKLKRTYRAPDTILAAPDEGIVLHVVTPRDAGAQLPESACTLRLIEHASGALRALMKDTEAFNKDAAGVDIASASGVFAQETIAMLGPAAETLDTLYRQADALALRYRDKYLALLKWLCAAGAMLVAAFLFYDEIEANLFLIAYGLIAAFAFILYRTSKNGRSHQKYIEYRLFAETLRVQLNLFAANLAVSAEDLMPWSQRTLSPWIREAMNALPLRAPTPSTPPADVRTIWLQDQLDYQQKTVARNEKRRTRQTFISGALSVFTIVFFVMVLLLEFCFPVWIAREIPLPDWLCRLALTHSYRFFNARSIFKILLGIIPAFTIVVSSYYGKLSLERKLRDGKRMVALYTEALEAEGNPATDKSRLYAELAREELIEVGDWLSYLADNRPDILI